MHIPITSWRIKEIISLLYMYVYMSLLNSSAVYSSSVRLLCILVSWNGLDFLVSLQLIIPACIEFLFLFFLLLKKWFCCCTNVHSESWLMRVLWARGKITIRKIDITLYLWFMVNNHWDFFDLILVVLKLNFTW